VCLWSFPVCRRALKSDSSRDRLSGLDVEAGVLLWQRARKRNDFTPIDSKRATTEYLIKVLVGHGAFGIGAASIQLNFSRLASFFGLAPAAAKVCNCRGAGVARVAYARQSAGALPAEREMMYTIYHFGSRVSRIDDQTNGMKTKRNLILTLSSQFAAVC
jgi:hypothetical protein